MNVVFGSDENFLNLIPTVVRSVHTHNSKHKITFHLLYNGRRSFLPFLDEEFAKFPNYELRVYDRGLSDMKFPQLRTLSHISSATMLRLFIPSILENLNGKVLYLDLDLLVNMDLTEIFNLEVPEIGIVAKRSLIKGLMREWLKDAKSKAKYTAPHSFNAGVLLMDLDKLRASGYVEKMTELMEKYPECNDQILLNLYCKGSYGKLPPYCNIFNHLEGRKVHKYDNFILHFTGARKPWKQPGRKCPNRKIWHKFEE